MSVANLEAYALSKGITTAFDKMTQGEQTMLRYQYIMQATADAQGDFARTSDGFANSQRLLQSNFESLKTTIGNLLVGPLANLTSWANDTLAKLTKPATTTVLDTFSDIDVDTTKQLAKIQETADEANALILTLQSIGAEAIETGNLKAAIETIDGDLTGLDSRVRGSAETMGLLAGSANKINADAGKRWDSFISAFDGSEGFTSAVQAAKDNDYKGVIDGLSESLSKTTNFKKEDWSTMLDTLATKVPNLNDILQNEGVSGAMTAIADAADDLGGQYPEMWQALVNALGSDNAVTMVNSLSGGVNAGTYLGMIADSANKLNADSQRHWEGWMQAVQKVTGSTFGRNAQDAKTKIAELARALSGNDADMTRAEAFQSLISTLLADTSELASLGDTDRTGVVEFLQNLAEAANTLEPDDANGWNTLLTALAAGFSGELGSEEGNAFRSAMAEYFLALGSGSEEAVAGLKALGYSTEDIEDSQKQWLATCKKLVQTIPGLAEIVNTETGAVEGGAEALAQYVGEWQKQQETILRLKAYYKKRAAVDEAKAGLYEYELDVKINKNRIKEVFEKGADKYGQDVADYIYDNILENGKFTLTTEAMFNLLPQGTTADDLDFFVEEFIPAVEKAALAEREYEKQKNAVAIADEEMMQIEEEYADDIAKYQELINGATDSTKEFNAAQKEAAKTAATDVKTAFEELNSYLENVRNSTEQSVRSVVKGFASVETPVGKTRKQVSDLTAEIAKLQKEGKDSSALEGTKSSMNATIPTINNMAQALRDQVKYMQDYQKYLNKARENGVSEEILTMLSDGSLESFDYLEALATGAGNINELNDAYRAVQEESSKFTDTLMEQKLSADEAYDGLIEKANAAVAALNQQEAARGAAAETIEGLVTGLKESESELSQEVENILAILAKLSGWNGLSINGLTFKGNVKPNNAGTAGAGFTEQEIHFNKSGLDYVPYDNFFSFLHEGEAVLTAEEAKVWRGIQMGGGTQGIDYDALGGVISGVKGGNVYLDGQIVGRLISDRQGDSYRRLERSGWQR